MTPFNMPLPAIQPPTAGEAAAARKAVAGDAVVARKAVANESNSDFKETLDDVSAKGKAAQKEVGEATKAKTREMTQKEARKESTPEPEVASTEKNNRSERHEEIKKTGKEQKQEEVSADFAAIPEVVLPFTPPPVEVGIGTVAGIAMGPGLNGQGVGVGVGTTPTLALKGVEDVLQVARGGTPVMGQNNPDSGGIPFELRPATVQNRQSVAQVNRPPLSAQSPTFSRELAERVGNLRLISRSGVSDQVRINLVPRDLGNLDIRLQVDGDSRVHMLVTTETEAAKELLKNQISQLRESLTKQGMEFGDVDIQVDLQQRGDRAETQAGFEWGGDSRFESDAGGGQDHRGPSVGGEVEEEPLIMGKVVRSSDGSMSVFI
jgi:hypothetical protein